MRKGLKKPYPEINILPEEYRPRLLTLFQWVLIGVILAGLIFSYFSLQSRGEAASELAELKAELHQLQEASSKITPELEQIKKLEAEIKDLKARLEKLKQAQAVMQSKRPDWASFLSPLFLSLPEGLKLSSITQEGLNISIEGVSYAGYKPIVEYYEHLKKLPSISSVFANNMEFKSGKEGKSSLTFSLTVKLKGG